MCSGMAGLPCGPILSQLVGNYGTKDVFVVALLALKLEEIVLDLLLTQAQLGSHQLLQGVGHVPGHAHVPTDIDVALLLMEHTEHLTGQLLPQDVLNIDTLPGRAWAVAAEMDIDHKELTAQ